MFNYLLLGLFFGPTGTKPESMAKFYLQKLPVHLSHAYSITDMYMYLWAISFDTITDLFFYFFRASQLIFLFPGYKMMMRS